MSIVVEEGAGLSNAESYCSVADADAYHAARGRTDWAALTTLQKESSLRVATDYMERTFGTRWRGRVTSASQALSWPRVGAQRQGFPGFLSSNSVPDLVRNACAELALASSVIDLSSDLTSEASGAVIKEKVGPIEVTYAEGVSRSASTSFSTINGMLAPLLASGANSIQVVRC